MRSLTCCILIIIVGLINLSSIFAQLKKLKENNLITEREIFVDQKTNLLYSDLIRVKFADKITRNCQNLNLVEIEDIINLDVKEILKEIESDYGTFNLSRLANFEILNDTKIKNKRTGEMVKIPDWSNVYKIIFEDLVCLDPVINKLNSSPHIEYAEGPFQAYQTISPNDEEYLNGDNWAFEVIQAEEAWDITKGDSTIVIGIHDNFGETNVSRLHDDLVGKVDRQFENFGGHGTCVAGVAGANTNNEIGIASLGWNLRLKFYDITYPIFGILNAINDGVDIINFSHTTRANLKAYRDAIKTALAAGIICIASAGNNYYSVPDTLYPAAYDFGELGQVISVSGTMLTENGEEFIEGFNYSPGFDPVNDPISSFMDVAAPGMDIATLSESCCSSYVKACGTSLSAPFVSSLAGLMLSIDKTLTGHDIYEILTQTTDKVGINSYDENGWNQYLGYGRINAHKALLEVQNRMIVNVSNQHIVETKISLQQNYPNPFNPSTTIKYSISNESVISNPLTGEGSVNTKISPFGRNDNLQVSLIVYDVLGREVSTLVNEKQKPGFYEVAFDGSDLTSGIYFYRIQAGDFLETKKMILLK